jgi:hypothetical protein
MNWKGSGRKQQYPSRDNVRQYIALFTHFVVEYKKKEQRNEKKKLKKQVTEKEKQLKLNQDERKILKHVSRLKLIRAMFHI